MKLRRREFLRCMCAAAIAPAMAGATSAQSYPARPVRLIVGFAAGSAADITTRLIAQWLSMRFDQHFVIDNRPGAGSNLAIEAMTKSPADGYTLGLPNVGNAIGATLYERLGFNINRDIASVAAVVRGTSVMEVTPSLPVRTVPGFIAYAKANPGKVNMASGGNGTVQHVAGELFRMMTGIDIVHVSYRGTAAAVIDLFSGRADVIFDNMASSIEHIRAGKLRPLAVTTAARSTVLPEVPTISEFVPGFEASTWSGVGAPKGTPNEVIGILNREINAALVDPKIFARFAELGATVIPGSPHDFGQLIARETEKWSKVVRFSGAKPG